MLKARLLQIGMAGHMFSEIFHPGDKRVIVRRQARDDFRKNTIDSSSLVHLKNTTAIKNFHSIWYRFREVNARSIRDEVPRSLFAGSVPVLRHLNRHIHDVDRVLDSFLQPTRSKIL